MEYQDLYDLVKRMLQWEAKDRINVDDIMRHRYWITSDPLSKKLLKESGNLASAYSGSSRGDKTSKR